MSHSTDCYECEHKAYCPYKDKFQRLPREEGGLGLCPKVTPKKLLRCRNCLFCHRVQMFNDAKDSEGPQGTWFGCKAMGDGRLRSDGKMPSTTPRDCPLKQEKDKEKEL